MFALFRVIDLVLQLYMWAFILSAIMSWLIAFNVINLGNRLVYAIYDILNRLTEPLLRPIRRFLPDLGGLDLSPMVVVLIIIFLRNLLWSDIAPNVL
jgi:YggT family protein